MADIKASKELWKMLEKSPPATPYIDGLIARVLIEILEKLEGKYMEIKRLTEDNGKILRINESGDHQTNAYQVGQYGVTQIVAYQEFGEHAMLNFIAVYRDGDIWVRLPANNLSIEYFPSKKEQPHD